MDFESQSMKILKNIEKRLFESEPLNRKTEVKNLKTPALQEDFFEDEVDELDIVEGEMGKIELNNAFSFMNGVPLASL